MAINHLVRLLGEKSFQDEEGESSIAVKPSPLYLAASAMTVATPLLAFDGLLPRKRLDDVVPATPLDLQIAAVRIQSCCRVVCAKDPCLAPRGPGCGPTLGRHQDQVSRRRRAWP